MLCNSSSCGVGIVTDKPMVSQTTKVYWRRCTPLSINL